jgi:hypothetical protein
MVLDLSLFFEIGITAAPDYPSCFNAQRTFNAQRIRTLQPALRPQ